MNLNDTIPYVRSSNPSSWSKRAPLQLNIPGKAIFPKKIVKNLLNNGRNLIQKIFKKYSENIYLIRKWEPYFILNLLFLFA